MLVTGDRPVERLGVAPTPIDFDHRANHQSPSSARAVLPLLLGEGRVRSLLDVGCGVGAWTAAARDLGVRDVIGIDGIALSQQVLLFPQQLFRRVDLTDGWDLGRRFDLVLCLEVAEHLDPAASELLVAALSGHADLIVFSAACPGQPGQHHVNCRWPDYWQSLFNARGFACADAIRWRIWNDADVDVWYRQNMFIATRDERVAGTEPRLRAVVHPEFLDHLLFARVQASAAGRVDDLRRGARPLGWYARLAWDALRAKLRRRADFD